MTRGRTAFGVCLALLCAAMPCAAQQTPQGRYAGCESARLSLPRMTDARGRAIAHWVANASDPVLQEGDRFLNGFEAEPPARLPAQEATVRAWVAAHNSHPIAHYVLGKLYSALGRLPDAMRSYTRALELAPGFSTAEYNLGVLLAESGRPLEAIPHFDRAIALDPTSLDAYYNAGMALYLSGQHENALAHWCGGRAVAPTDFDTAKKIVQALHALGRFSDAERARASVRELHARSTDPRVRRMRSYVIDQRRIGSEEIMVEEQLDTSGPLQRHYAFVTARVRAVTVESSAVAREQGVAALVGIEFPGGRHATTNIQFRAMPTYEALRPQIEALITRLQSGDNTAIVTTSTPSP